MPRFHHVCKFETNRVIRDYLVAGSYTWERSCLLRGFPRFVTVMDRSTNIKRHISTNYKSGNVILHKHRSLNLERRIFVWARYFSVSFIVYDNFSHKFLPCFLSSRKDYEAAIYLPARRFISFLEVASWSSWRHGKYRFSFTADIRIKIEKC